MTAPRIIVSLHDVAPATATASARWLEVVERQQMVATLLVVPGPWRGSSIDTRPELDGQYAVIGQVIEGEDVPAQLQVGDEIRRVYVRD